MKRILLLFAAICSLQVAVAQKTIGKLPYDSVKVGGLKPNATYYDAVVKIEKGKLISDVVKADSISYIPLRDTLFTPERIGAMTVRPQDLTNYICLSVTPGTKKWFKNSIISSADLPIVISGSKVSMPASDYNQDGYLAAVDYTRFDSATRRWKIKTSTMYPYSYLYNVNIGDTIATSYKLNVKGTLNTTADALINGLTVGQGAGGSQSVVLGFEAGLLNTGIENTLIGHQAGKTNSGLLMVNIGYLNGNNNTGSNGGAVAIGASSFVNRSGGLYNIAIGYNTMSGGGNGGNNVAVGKASQNGNGSFNDNTSVGNVSLNNNTGDGNTALGFSSLLSNTTGTRNLAIGYYAGAYNTTVGHQLFVGVDDMTSYARAQTRSLMYGVFDTSLTTQKLTINGDFQATKDVKGNSLTFDSLVYNMDGLFMHGSNGKESVFLGHQSGNQTKTGSYNTGVGQYTLNKITTGEKNTGLGKAAGYNITTGSNNTLVGNNRTNATTGSNNTEIGGSTSSGIGASTGSGNISIGYNTSPDDPTANNQLNIGGWIKGREGNIGINTNDSSQRLVINGNVKLLTAGNKFYVATGSNASMGTATLSSGTVTVNTTAVTTGSKIFVSYSGTLTNPGFITTVNIVNGTSFDITSSSGTDGSAVNWWIIN